MNKPITAPVLIKTAVTKALTKRQQLGERNDMSLRDFVLFELDSAIYAFFREEFELPMKEASDMTDLLMTSRLVMTRVKEFEE